MYSTPKPRTQTPESGRTMICTDVWCLRTVNRLKVVFYKIIETNHQQIQNASKTSIDIHLSWSGFCLCPVRGLSTPAFVTEFSNWFRLCFQSWRRFSQSLNLFFFHCFPLLDFFSPFPFLSFLPFLDFLSPFPFLSFLPLPKDLSKLRLLTLTWLSKH